MKILHLSSEKTWRGGEQQIAYLIEELQKNEVECIVACRENSSFEDYCKMKSLSYKSFPFKGSSDFKTAYLVKKFANAQQVDIIHLHTSNTHTIGVLASLFGAKASLVLTRRVDFKLKRNFLSKFKYNYQGIKRIICVSEKIRQIILPEIKEESKCVTIHSGIDIKKFSNVRHYNYLRNKYKIDAEFLLIGNVAAIAPHKDLFTFIDTAEILVRQGIKAKFFMIGDGPLREEVESYLCNKKMGEHIFMTGFLKNIPEILRELDIFLFTSKTEGLGTIILDAFASKLPVVATDAGGIPELVRHRETGLLSEVGKSEDLARNVISLINDPDLKSQIIMKAYQTVSIFSKENTGLKNLEVYKEILGAQGN